MLQDVIEDPITIDVGEVCTVQGVELIHQSHQLRVEDSNGAVDLLDAGDAIRASLRKLVRAAPHPTHSYQRHLPRPVVVQYLNHR